MGLSACVITMITMKIKIQLISVSMAQVGRIMGDFGMPNLPSFACIPMTLGIMCWLS